MRLARLRSLLGGARDTGAAAPVRAVPSGMTVRPTAAAPRPLWTPERLELVESLWGDGCHWPGVAEETLRLAAPLGLSAASSLLLAGAGAGAGALRLASDLGAWVEAAESDPVLAAAAARRVKAAGGALGKRVSVQRWDPAKPAFRTGAFHHAIAVDVLHRGDPAAVLAAIAAALRPGGQLVVVETVAGSEPDTAGMPDWCRLERRAMPPPGTDWLTAPLLRLGFDIRVSEDIGSRQMHLAVAGWKRLVRSMDGERPSPAYAAVMVAEAELWLRRIALLRGGQLRVMRWHAIAAARGAQAVAA